MFRAKPLKLFPSKENNLNHSQSKIAAGDNNNFLIRCRPEKLSSEGIHSASHGQSKILTPLRSSGLNYS